MELTKSRLRSIIKEELSRALGENKTLSENKFVDSALVLAQMNPSSGQLGVLSKAHEMQDYDTIIRAGAQDGITPQTAYEWFLTPGEGLEGLPNTVAPMVATLRRRKGDLAALNFAFENGAEINLPGFDMFGSDKFPFDVKSIVLAKARNR